MAVDDNVTIPLSESADALLDAMHACFADARDPQIALLPALRLAARCLGPLLRITRTLPAHLTLTLAALHQLSALALAASMAAHDAKDKRALAYRSIQVSCQIHLARVALHQIRVAERAITAARRAAPRSAVAPHADDEASAFLPSMPTPAALTPLPVLTTASVAQGGDALALQHFHTVPGSHVLVPRATPVAAVPPTVDATSAPPSRTLPASSVALPHVMRHQQHAPALAAKGVPPLSEEKLMALERVLGIYAQQPVPPTIGAPPRLASKRSFAWHQQQALRHE